MRWFGFQQNSSVLWPKKKLTSKSNMERFFLSFFLSFSPSRGIWPQCTAPNLFTFLKAETRKYQLLVQITPLPFNQINDNLLISRRLEKFRNRSNGSVHFPAGTNAIIYFILKRRPSSLTNQTADRSSLMACRTTTTKERQREEQKDSETSPKDARKKKKCLLKCHRTMSNDACETSEDIVVADRDHFARSSTLSEKPNHSRKYDIYIRSAKKEGKTESRAKQNKFPPRNFKSKIELSRSCHIHPSSIFYRETESSTVLQNLQQKKKPKKTLEIWN